MDKEVVEQKLAQLKEERAALLADYHRLDGAVQILESMLEEWDRTDEPAES